MSIIGQEKGNINVNDEIFETTNGTKHTLQFKLSDKIYWRKFTNANSGKHIYMLYVK